MTGMPLHNGKDFLDLPEIEAQFQRREEQYWKHLHVQVDKEFNQSCRDLAFDLRCFSTPKIQVKAERPDLNMIEDQEVLIAILRSSAELNGRS
jgi:hypothetical protein